MVDFQIVWDDEDDPEGNLRHILDGHDVTIDEIEEVLLDLDKQDIRSRSSGRPITIGVTSTGRKIAVVWEEICDDPRLIYPVTAYCI